MKRIVLYVLILAAMFALPVERTDVGKLRPIQTVSISKNGGWTILRTDTEDIGMGKTVQEALDNLKATTPGVVYLDTAVFLLVAEEAQDSIQDLRQVLRKNVKVCVADRGIDPVKATEYLAAHDNLPKLKHWEEGMQLPVLELYNQQEIILKKVEKRA